MVKSTKLNVAVAVWTSDPLVPVTVRVKVPAVVELQETVAVPEPVTVPGVIAAHVRPAGTVSVRVTTPAKPLTAVIVIVETADWPALTAAGELAAMVKSTKLKVAVAVWTSDPLVPVTVRVKVPAVVELQETVAVPEPVTVPGVIAPHVNPAGTVSVRVTTPAKPLTAVIVIVDTADWPALTAAGLDAVIVKSGGAPNVNVAVAEWTSEPLVPVIVTVKTFWVVALQLRVAVPEPVTVPGVIAPQVRPAGTVSVRVTTPAKPFTAVIVIVEVAEEPAGTAAGDVAAMVKSTKLNVAVAVWTSDPLVQV